MKMTWREVKGPKWTARGDVLLLTAAVGSAAMLDLFSAESIKDSLHLALVDSGASETVGSPEAIDALLHHLRSNWKDPIRVTVRTDKKQRFRVANGEVIKALSVVEIETPLGDLSVHCIATCNTSPTPILLSISALRTLGSAIDFRTRTIAIAGKEVTLHKNTRGHLLLDFVQFS